jgi:hypothetical protein
MRPWPVNREVTLTVQGPAPPPACRRLIVDQLPDIERRGLSSLRAAVSGGSPAPAGLVRQVEATPSR